MGNGQFLEPTDVLAGKNDQELSIRSAHDDHVVVGEVDLIPPMGVNRPMRDSA